MTNCLTCAKEIKYQCRCGSFGCDEGFLRAFCNEKCRDEYENNLIPRAIEFIDSLPEDKVKLLNEVLGSDEEVIYYLWYKYF